ncbi:MAG: dTMP kinase [Candidatus Omnitrophota bacterium]
MKGLFITFEGSEGCGKSTQSKLLCEFLKRKGFAVVFLREPGATRISEKIRDILLDGKNQAISAECEMLLYMAARAQIVSEVIKPELAKGKIVVCDRFLDSTLAYQGYGLGVNLAAIKYTGKFATQGIKPDLTIFLDLPLEIGLRHRAKTQDRIEQRHLSYHKRVRAGYLKLIKLEPSRIKLVKVAESIAETQNRIRELVSRVLSKRS